MSFFNGGIARPKGSLRIVFEVQVVYAAKIQGEFFLSGSGFGVQKIWVVEEKIPFADGKIRRFGVQNARSRFDKHDLAKGVGVHFLLPVGGFFQLSRIQEFGAAAAGTVFIDGIVLAHRRVLQMQRFHALIIAHIADELSN